MDGVFSILKKTLEVDVVNYREILVVYMYTSIYVLN